MSTEPQLSAESRDHPALFLLATTRVLPSGRLTEDMVEALVDSEVSSHAPGILSVICEWMELHRTHTFTVSATRAKNYHLNLPSSMLSCLEQFPALVAWLGNSAATAFLLDINDQGSDLRIELTRVADRIHHACIEDHWRTATRIQGDWDDSPQSLHDCCRKVAQVVREAATAMNAKIESLPAFREWCVNCGLILDEGVHRSVRK